MLLRAECKPVVSPHYDPKHIPLQTVMLYFRKPTHEGLVQAVDCNMFKEDSFN